VTPRIAQVAPELVRPLRQAVLRPHQTVAEQVYAGDDAPGAAHFAAFADSADSADSERAHSAPSAPLAGGDAAGQVIGIASITPEPHPVSPAPGDWRIRGMATDPDHGRGTGAGALLLAACVEHARAEGGTRVWCNARTPAVGFYARAGFATEGEEFELPAIGPHFLMALDL
jgi:ribosomal protein S18 acetylase RimI-like enzyme